MGNYNIAITIQHAIANAAGIVLLLLTLGINTPWILGVAAVFGLAGGSVNDLISWRRNKDAINFFANSNTEEPKVEEPQEGNTNDN